MRQFLIMPGASRAFADFCDPPAVSRFMDRSTIYRASLKTVLFRDGSVSLVLKSSCNRLYSAVFRARLPCHHKKILVFRGALYAEKAIGRIDRVCNTQKVMTDVTCSLESSVLQISLSGPFDRLASVKIPEYIKRYQTNLYSKVIIDLSSVSIIDSPGLDLLFVLSRIMRMNGGEVILLNPQVHVRDMLSRTDILNLATLECGPGSNLTTA